ncbi:MAG: endonuclease III domain-containing protein [Nitrospirota bacterium]
MNTKRRLLKIYDSLFSFYGPQHWWPGETPFEVAVGAILTQNTNWTNVEKAIANLRKARLLSPKALRALPTERLAALIRPAGYFNVKASRLKAFLDFLGERYGSSMDRMRKQDMQLLREEMLGVKGIGPETADSILLYALDKPVFVIDAYTKRVLSRHGILDLDASYRAYQDLFHRAFDEDVPFFNEYHALMVMVGKDFCKPEPRCERCPLRERRPSRSR